MRYLRDTNWNCTRLSVLKRQKSLIGTATGDKLGVEKLLWLVERIVTYVKESPMNWEEAIQL